MCWTIQYIEGYIEASAHLVAFRDPIPKSDYCSSSSHFIVHSCGGRYKNEDGNQALLIALRATHHPTSCCGCAVDATCMVGPHLGHIQGESQAVL